MSKTRGGGIERHGRGVSAIPVGPRVPGLAIVATALFLGAAGPVRAQSDAVAGQDRVTAYRIPAEAGLGVDLDGARDGRGLGPDRPDDRLPPTGSRRGRARDGANRSPARLRRRRPVRRDPRLRLRTRRRRCTPPAARQAPDARRVRKRGPSARGRRRRRDPPRPVPRP